MNILKQLYLDALALLQSHQTQIEEAIALFPDSPVTETIKMVDEVVNDIETKEGDSNVSN